MPKIHADNTGKILRFTNNRATDAQYPEPPVGTASTIEFDALSNEALLRDMARSTEGYELKGTTLTKNGQPVTIAPDSPDGYDKVVKALDRMPADITAATSLADLKPILTKQANILRKLLDHVVLEG
jgi:hypothetical protein